MLFFFRADSSAYSTGEIPSLENFTGIIYEFWVEENQYSAVYVEDGEMKGCGCDPDLTEFLNGDGQPRTQVEGCKKPTFWEWLAGGAGDFGDFFAGLGNGIWSGIGWLGSQIGNLFNGILGTFKGNFPAGSNGGLNSWSSLSSGGTFSFGFGNGYGPNGGTNGFPGSGGSYNLSLHFSEFEIKKIQNVAEWMNNTYGVNLSNSELTLLMPINCI